MFFSFSIHCGNNFKVGKDHQFLTMRMRFFYKKVGYTSKHCQRCSTCGTNAPVGDHQVVQSPVLESRMSLFFALLIVA